MTTPLIDRLGAEPQRFDLFRALQLLEMIGRDATDSVNRGPYDQGDDIALPIRFSAHQSLSFPAHEIHHIALPTPGSPDGPPARVALNAMTLTGPASALPQVYTETAIQSLRDHAPGFTAFLDLFNDRIAALFYRGWQRYRLPALYERDRQAGADAASAALFSIAGFGTGHLKGRLAVEDEVPLFFAGLFSQQPRAAASLERMLADVCGLPVRIEQFSGRWIAIPTEEQSTLGDGYNRLGIDAVAGARVWDVQGQFRIVLGPLNRRQFLDHLPGKPGLQRIIDLTRVYVGPELGFDVQLVLCREEVPDCILGGGDADPPRLGYDTWLATLPLPQDPHDTILDIKDAC
ncbi:type VI secretion system baseplate subunit TssG [Telmatospirillum sp.]|uniref:type VI secretion system baseplate subunit TssG n=1 Tax=Telmatospirillum sp. TaxID=2079197 RepID=UPI00284142C5|nr:type VI secretion system baseplate subunit TssG [Telmatospirillum sp.]MDR3435249.1 type VI secretion system baseplate subunit TssG [Telmatospirillum sp.]